MFFDPVIMFVVPVKVFSVASACPQDGSVVVRGQRVGLTGRPDHKMFHRWEGWG